MTFGGKTLELGVYFDREARRICFMNRRRKSANSFRLSWAGLMSTSWSGTRDGLTCSTLSVPAVRALDPPHLEIAALELGHV